MHPNFDGARLCGAPHDGKLWVPLVTLHTTGDLIIPCWHEARYTIKALSNGSGLLHTNIPILQYGLCNFEPSKVP